MKNIILILFTPIFLLSIFSFQFFKKNDYNEEIVVILKKKKDRKYSIPKNFQKVLDCNCNFNPRKHQRFFKCTTKKTAQKTIDIFNTRKNQFPQIEYIEENVAIEIVPLNFNNQATYGNDTIPPPGQWSLNGTSHYDANYWEAIDSFNVTGEGVVIAIIDGTIQIQHDDLRDAIWQNLGEDVDGDGVVIQWDPIINEWVLDPDDLNGIDDDGNGYVDDLTGWNFMRNDNLVYGWSQWGYHGTHCGGIACAQHNDIGTNGVAPGATILPVVIVSHYSQPTSGEQEKTTSSIMLYDLMRVFSYAAEYADIINCSWKNGSNEEPSYGLRIIISDAIEQGALVVTAAGNDGLDLDNNPIHPGSIGNPGILNVGSISLDGERAASSSYSARRCDIFAPGDSIWSLRDNNGIGMKSGTSMAAPFAAGAAALSIEHHEDTLSAQQLKQMLMCSAKKNAALDTTSISGGYVDVLGALGMPVPRVLDISVILEGVYDPFSGNMRNDLINRNLLPDGQSYEISPWDYSGDEGRGWRRTDYPIDVVDWVLVSLRADISKASEFLRVAALLKASGQIDFSSSDCSLFFDEMPVDSAYIVIEHRNHMGIMTPHPVYIDGESITYDFRTTESYTGGETGGGFGQKQLPDGTWAMFAGDAHQSDLPSYQITGQDKSFWFNDNGTFNQYLPSDFNLDGDVNGEDKGLWFDNNGISSRVPK